MVPSLTGGGHIFGARKLVLHAIAPIAFVGAYVVTGEMEIAIWALVAVAIVSLFLGIVLDRRLLPLPLVVGCFSIATAFLAAYFANPDILKIKASVVHALIGVGLLGLAAFGLNPFARLFGGSLLTERGWRRLIILSGVLSLATALINIIVWRTQPEAVWVFFHFPGSMLLHLSVLATQIGWLKRDHAHAQARDAQSRQDGAPEEPAVE